MEPYDQEFWNFGGKVIDIKQIRYIEVVGKYAPNRFKALEIFLPGVPPVILRDKEVDSFIKWFEPRFGIELIDGWESPNGSSFS